ncbi:MAG: AAA family ATPase [Gammaproteobacteria bacterium]|nr:AAA family ATPase [Gammaproteobacteria bacterium]
MLMIHTFSVINYGSIRDEVTLDLRIPGTAPDLACFRRSVATPDLRLPTVAVLMGPNGSGKTTLLRALVDLGRIVSSPTNAVELLPFLSSQTRWEPTRFALEGEGDFLAPGETPQRFRYELAVGRQPMEDGTAGPLYVSHEALVHFPRGRRRRLLERQTPGAPVYVSRDLGLGARDDRLKAIEPNRSAISILALLNVPVATRFARAMGDSLVNASNISGNETFTPTTSTVIGWLEASEDARQWAQAQIQRSDLGIEGMEVVDGFGDKLIRFNHSGLDTPILLDFESKGTRRLLHLLPLIKFALDVTGLTILDEIDGELHVDMLAEILSWFRSRESNPRDAQLLVSSHHVGLLDDLEKEEVFVVEKDGSGATRLYGAQDVRGLRRDVRLYPKYRGGVLGGLPRFG